MIGIGICLIIWVCMNDFVMVFCSLEYVWIIWLIVLDWLFVFSFGLSFFDVSILRVLFILLIGCRIVWVISIVVLRLSIKLVRLRMLMNYVC